MDGRVVQEVVYTYTIDIELDRAAFEMYFPAATAPAKSSGMWTAQESILKQNAETTSSAPAAASPTAAQIEPASSAPPKITPQAWFKAALEKDHPRRRDEQPIDYARRLYPLLQVANLTKPWTFETHGVALTTRRTTSRQNLRRKRLARPALGSFLRASARAKSRNCAIVCAILRRSSWRHENSRSHPARRSVAAGASAEDQREGGRRSEQHQRGDLPTPLPAPHPQDRAAPRRRRAWRRDRSAAARSEIR